MAPGRVRMSGHAVPYVAADATQFAAAKFPRNFLHTMDIVFIRELRLDAWIGIYKYEKAARQTIELDLEIGLPGDAVFKTHKVRDTVDYASVVQRLKALLENEHFGLVETLADRIAMLLLDEFHTPHVRVSVAKLGVLREAKRVGAIVERNRS